ncbi:MAG: hypothetical protein ABMA13_23610 [Chthoniobacteraceae bacterium]
MKGSRFHTLLTCGLALAAGCVGYQWSIAPVRQRESEGSRSVSALRQQIDGARKAIGEVHTLEARFSRERHELDTLHGDLPSGPALVWFPERVKEHFARVGSGVVIVRLNTTMDVPDLPDFRRGYWSVGWPIDEAAGNVSGLMLAVAEFEQQNAFVRVLDFAIRPDPENPGGRMAALNVTALIPRKSLSR